MHKLLIVEDDAVIRAQVEGALSATYAVRSAETLRAAERLLAAEKFDLILLDAGLPDGDGFRFCASLRSSEATRDIPIIFMTGRGEVLDKLMGFSVGADDYVTKPFDLKELKARVAVRLKTTVSAAESTRPLRKGDLRIEVAFQRVSLVRGTEEKELSLTGTEFKILSFLAPREEEVFDREKLIRAIWGEDVHVTPRTIDTHVSNLRKKLAASEYTIVSVLRSGYKFTRRVPAAKVA